MLQLRSAALYVIVLLFSGACGYGQSAKKNIRKGNKNFEEKKYEESEVYYRKAANEEDILHDAIFNLGDALYKQEKYKDAVNEFNNSANSAENNDELAKTYHNLGNSLLKSKQIEKSIEAYKKSLRYNPGDKETKYNLAYARDLLKKQQQNKNKNQQQNKDKQKQDREKEEQQKQEQQKQNDQNQDKKKQQSQKISKEDAKRLLNALANDEKKVQEKVKKAKAQMKKVKTEKDW